MRLVIEDSDVAKTGLAAGEYDLDDLDAVDEVYDIAAHTGGHAEIGIDLIVHKGAKPEPGSTGEPHFKVGVTVEKRPASKDTKIIAFARPQSGESFAYSKIITDAAYARWNDPELTCITKVKDALHAITSKTVDAIVKRAVAQIVSPPWRTPISTNKVDRIIPCDECKGSGEWINPANNVKSDCSKGCGS